MSNEGMETTGDFGGKEQAESQAIYSLNYTPTVDELLQKAIVNHEERHAFSILYALNSKLKSKIIKNYLKSNLGLSISVKGKGREQVLDVVKYGSGYQSRGFMGKIRETLNIDE